MRYIVFTGILVAFVCGTARAHVKSGAELRNSCNAFVSVLDSSKGSSAMTSFQGVQCVSYMDGATDGAIFASGVSGAAPEYCIENVSEEQMARTYIKYVNQHPEQLQKPAIMVFTLAMHTAYPCKKR